MPSLTKRNRFVMLLFLNMFNAVYMIYWYVSVLKELSFFRGKKFSGALAAVIIICTVFLALFYYDYKICNLLRNKGLYMAMLVLRLLVIGIIINPLFLQGRVNKESYLHPADLTFN